MKLAIVVPRYGASIVGGAEALARRIGGSLARSHTVTVLTTTAVDYRTWHDELPAGADQDGPIRVLRFPVAGERGDYWTQLHFLLHAQIEEPFASLPEAHKRRFQRYLATWPLALQEEYVRHQGPSAPGLYEWLRRHGGGQDRILFFIYLYAPTYFGMRCVGRTPIDFYPAFHDEPPAYLPLVGDCFRRADRILFSTMAEQLVAGRRHAFARDNGVVLGYGASEPEPASIASEDDTPFLLYAGRIDPAKGIGELVEYFLRWRSEHPGTPLQLRLIGDCLMELPRHPDIQHLGYQSEAAKAALMRQALALVHPSPFESLGLVLLEAFLCGTPALVWAGNEILVEHCRVANGGLWYDDYPEFAAAVSWLVDHPADAKLLGAQGRAYAQREYSPERFEERLAALYPS
jgi:glycosyltransferase involved in cell wall biosynthesis